MVNAWDIRQRFGDDILDYQQVMSMLGDYAKPRDRIGAMLTKGELIRVRKGLYVLGDGFRHGLIDQGRLANLIYGPSYVSLDYALGYYGLIPERVDEVTSVTTGKRRLFETPFGVFSYRPLPPARYVPGMTLTGSDRDRFLLASPEKALIDKIWCDKRFRPRRIEDFGAYLYEDLRMDEERLVSLDAKRMTAIANAFASHKTFMLLAFWERQKGRSS
jgi:hypothetical protein